jgi:hypothetical protein
MPPYRTIKLVLVFSMLALCGLWLVSATGCGAGGSTTPGLQEQQDTSSDSTEKAHGETTQPSKDEPGKQTTPKQPDGAEVDAVTGAARASAQANNPALGNLEVMDVKIVGSWARVDMQPEDRSTDSASWLLQKANGTWTVVDFGTSILPADHPDAPAAVFQ